MDPYEKLSSCSVEKFLVEEIFDLLVLKLLLLWIILLLTKLFPLNSGELVVDVTAQTRSTGCHWSLKTPCHLGHDSGSVRHLVPNY